MLRLRNDFGHRLMTEEELREDIRSGEVGPADPVHYEPWTGRQERPLAEIPEVAAVLASAEAQMARRLRAPPLPWLTLASAAVLLGAGATTSLREVGAVDLLTSGGWSFWMAALSAYEPGGGEWLWLGALGLFGVGAARLERLMGRRWLLGAVLAPAVLGGLVHTWTSAEAGAWLALHLPAALLGAAAYAARSVCPRLPALRRDAYGLGLVGLALAALILQIGALAAPAGLALLPLTALLAGTSAALLPPLAARPRYNACFAAGMAAVLALPAGLAGAMQRWPEHLLPGWREASAPFGLIADLPAGTYIHTTDVGEDLLSWHVHSQSDDRSLLGIHLRLTGTPPAPGELRRLPFGSYELVAVEPHPAGGAGSTLAHGIAGTLHLQDLTAAGVLSAGPRTEVLLALSQEMQAAGDLTGAEVLLREAVSRATPEEEAGVRQALFALWQAHPAVQPSAAVTLALDWMYVVEPEAGRLRMLNAAPEIIEFLKAEGACQQALDHLDTNGAWTVSDRWRSSIHATLAEVGLCPADPDYQPNTSGFAALHITGDSSL